MDLLGDDDAGVRARVAGLQDTERKTAWQLTVGAASLRCVAVLGGWSIQVRSGPNGWSSWADGKNPKGDRLEVLLNDPLEMLKRVLQLAPVIHQMGTRVREIVAASEPKSGDDS